jgi:hypothetical protein
MSVPKSYYGVLEGYILLFIIHTEENKSTEMKVN